MEVYAYDQFMMGSNTPIQGVVPIQAYPPNQMAVQRPIVVQGQNIALPQFAGTQYVLMQNDPLTELETCTSVIIRQQPEFFELFSGCETQNRYHVFGISPQGYKYMFRCREISGFCMRNCCPSEMREFNMEISQILLNGQLQLFANAFKPFKCSCCCFNRPVIHLNVGEHPVGTIKHLLSCWDPWFEVFESNGNLKYFVSADCCQCGILYTKNICGKFSPAVFNIFAAGTQSIVATITKMSAQSFSEVVTDADSYQITFPPDSTAYDKLLLIALGLMIDYQYFETDGNGNNGGHMGRRHYYY